jgi:hypothetical protein
MSRLFKYLLISAALLSLVASLLLEYVPRLPDGSFCFGCVLFAIALTLSAVFSQKAIVLAGLALWLAASLARDRWRHLLAALALASWLAMHLLNYVSGFAGWFVVLFKICWLALFLMALAALFHRRWRELGITGLALFFTFNAFLLTSLVPEPVVLPNLWLQKVGFRIYGSHLIRTMSPELVPSECKLIDYIEEDGTKQQVGECNKGLRSTVWFRLLVVYDPSGQLAWPAVQRTLAWRLAVLHLPGGRSFVHDDDTPHLVGHFYWFLDSSPDPGDDGKVRAD